jgi:hypothetical protein
MSYQLRVVALDPNDLSAVDSQSAEVLASIQAGQAREIQSHAEWFADEIGQGHPSLAVAMEHLVYGTVPADAPGYVYGYALAAIAGHLGRRLHGNNFSGIRYRWLDRMDQVLVGLGAPDRFRVTGLIEGGVPVSVPRIDDFPALGWTSPEVIDEARAWVSKADFSGQKFDESGSLTDLKRWLGETPAGNAWLGVYS